MRKRSTLVSFTLCFGLTAGLGLAGCVPAAMDNNNGSGGQGGSSSGTGGSSGRGGSGGSSTGGSGGSSSGTGGSSSGTGGASGGSGGASGGSGGASGGSGGAAGGSGGSAGSGGSGGTGGSAGGTGGSKADGGKPEAGGSPDAGTGAVTFKKLYAEVFNPTCGGPTGRCHQVVRDTYFIFDTGMEMRSYMLLVPNAPAQGSIPQRVMTLLNYVTPTTPGNPATVRMPPQSGPNLGNPQIKRMPLTAEQIAQIRTWAMTGAKFE